MGSRYALGGAAVSASIHLEVSSLRSVVKKAVTRSKKMDPDRTRVLRIALIEWIDEKKKFFCLIFNPLFLCLCLSVHVSETGQRVFDFHTEKGWARNRFVDSFASQRKSLEGKRGRREVSPPQWLLNCKKEIWAKGEGFSTTLYIVEASDLATEWPCLQLFT